MARRIWTEFTISTTPPWPRCPNLNICMRCGWSTLTGPIAPTWLPRAFSSSLHSRLHIAVLDMSFKSKQGSERKLIVWYFSEGMKPIWKPGLRLQSNNSSLSLPRGHLFCGGTLWLYNHKVLVAQQQSPWLFPPRNALHTKLSFLWTIKFGAEIKLKEEYCAIVEFTLLQYVQQCTATVGIDLRWNYSFTTVSCSRGSLWPALRHFF